MPGWLLTHRHTPSLQSLSSPLRRLGHARRQGLNSYLMRPLFVGFIDADWNEFAETNAVRMKVVETARAPYRDSTIKEVCAMASASMTRPNAAAQTDPPHPRPCVSCAMAPASILARPCIARSLAFFHHRRRGPGRAGLPYCIALIEASC